MITTVKLTRRLLGKTLGGIIAIENSLPDRHFTLMSYPDCAYSPAKRITYIVRGGGRIGHETAFDQEAARIRNW